MVRPTEAVVDLAAIVHNYREAVALGGRPVIAVVKAGAYGHGAVAVSKALVRAGAPMLAVVLVEEGLELREAGIEAPILVLGGAYGDRHDLLVRHHLTPVVFTVAQVQACAAAARTASARLPVHVKVDTGMGRLGAQPVELAAIAEALKQAPELSVEGVCSHFASADLADRALTERQVREFNAASVLLEKAGFPIRARHIANSAGTIDFPDARQDFTRPGLALYGYSPFGGGRHGPSPVAPPVELRPALTWKTAVIHLKTVPAGTPISYGGRWVARRESRIATLPVGYADGYGRHFGNWNLEGLRAPAGGTGDTEVLVRGRRARIAGTVCMDSCMVDVTDVPGAAVGDEVVLLGAQGGERIDAEELARRAGTISYEILCAIGSRVPRRHVGGPA